jgi:hypothetical protein
MRVENSYTEYGVRLGDSQTIVSKGRGYYGKLHAEQEVARIAHNAKLPFVGQPEFGTLVSRDVIEITETTNWAEV